MVKCDVILQARLQHVYTLYRSGEQLVVFLGNTLVLPQFCDVLVGKMAKLGAELVQLCQLVLQRPRYLLPYHIKHLHKQTLVTH